ncbi:MAG: hypothetical protein JXA54_05485 [Candidatus Heimdallarchaeota archaeon]|nr:hypothetical protein [Candidatus Heimdallarchaeota archaeon]
MKLELINEPLKVIQSTIIVDLEDTMITIGKRSRMFPVVDTKSYETIGFYIIGEVYLGADTIVNTAKGAVGEAIEKLSKEAFVKYSNIDLSNTKSDDINEKDFRNIELKAYRNFERLHRSEFARHGHISINGNYLSWTNKIDALDFFAYLFEPEEFILIKDNESLIALSKDDREVIVCDKKKNAYVEVSKKDGVRVSNNNGEIIRAGSTNGLTINGKNLNEIISGALRPIQDMFSNRKF